MGRPVAEFVFMIHIREVEHLLSISAAQKRRRDAEIINRAAVVFLVAVWQTYVEHLADELAKVSTTSVGSPNRLSTPNTANVDALFNRLCGVPRVSKCWKWRGMTCDRARMRLDRLLAVRHQIAHKARLRGTLTRNAVLKYVHLVHRVAICLYNHLAHVSAIAAGAPAPQPIRYGGIIGRFAK